MAGRGRLAPQPSSQLPPNSPGCHGPFALRGRLLNFLDGFLPCVVGLNLG